MHILGRYLVYDSVRVDILIYYVGLSNPLE